MLRALRQLLWRGAVSLSVCVTTALCIVGFLSLIASSNRPHEKTIADLLAGCKSSHCGHNAGDGRQLAEVRGQ
jgi:hypothetical protein